jgi:hypothetical protein
VLSSVFLAYQEQRGAARMLEFLVSSVSGPVVLILSGRKSTQLHDRIMRIGERGFQRELIVIEDIDLSLATEAIFRLIECGLTRLQ